MIQVHTVESFAKDLTIFFSAAILATSACTNLWMTGWQSGSATFYGVRVDPEFENCYEGTDIDSAYTRQVIWLTIALFALVFAFESFIPIYRLPLLSPFWITGLILAHALGMRLLYWRARQKVLSFAAPLGTVRTVDLATFVTLSREWKLVYWSAVLMPFAMLAMTALYLRANFNFIPLSLALPNHLGAPAPMIGWTKSTVYGVYKPLVQGVLLNLTSVLAAYAFNYRSRISEWGAEVSSRWTYRKVLMSRLAVIQWLVSIQCVLRALFPLAGTKALPIASERLMLIRLLWTVVQSIVSLVLLFKLYRSRPTGAADTAPDRSWKLGQYYINPRDPALIVPTRFGVGHTLNLGQPLAWTIPLVGALALISILAGPNYISQRPTAQANFLRTRPSFFPLGGIAFSPDRGALMDAVRKLKQGDAAAAQTIQELAKQHQGDLQFLNNAAYELALANKEIPSARLYAEQTVNVKEGQLRNLELGYLKPGDVYRLRDLAMFWDTLGWVCYRQGEMDCSHKYLLAAWALNRRALFGSHLARVEEEQGNLAEATADYEQALGATGQPTEKQDIEYRLNALANTREHVAHEIKEIPLEHMVRRSDVFYVDLLFQNASAGGKKELPTVGKELKLTGPVLNESEKTSIAKSLPRFPFPDAGPERILVRVRVTCLKESKAPCSMLPYTPDQTRNEFYRPGTFSH